MSTPVKDQIESLFNPTSVAVIASFSGPGWGLGVMHKLVDPNSRKIYPINPNVNEVFGKKAYPSIKEVPDPVDMAVLAVPYKELPNAMRECASKGVKTALVITAGLSETGAEGKAVEDEILKITKEAGIRFIGPNSMGHMNTWADLSTTAWVGNLRKGPVALLSQSGTYGCRVLEEGNNSGMGFSKFVSCGNEADLTLEDYLEYLGEDEHTKVIAIYAEGLRRGKRFFDLASEITRRKPIVVMKAGRTESATKAAKSHTAAIGGADHIYDAMFKQSGCIRVEEDDELLDIVYALTALPYPKGRRVGILTNGGGIGVVASDECERSGLTLPSFSKKTFDKLNQMLPSRWSHGNPADMTDTGSRGEMVALQCLWAIMEDENVDMMMLIGGVDQPAGTDFVKIFSITEEMIAAKSKKLAEDIEETVKRMKACGKPLVVSRLIVGPSAGMDKFKEYCIPVLEDPRRAANVLRHLVWYQEYLSSRSDT
ncbi:MAG: CoA-binding protein [Desulfatiglans sp.]|jgi:acyl-CoA synthetase (NDP forming)|nr:CoA-binding protein [Thermodesulfobacteriota bacterium]MEE4353043.1 CoA-binding protein [Desulfatiglans sp.]